MTRKSASKPGKRTVSTRNLTLRPKGAKAVKGGLSSTIVPCYKPGLIIPCITTPKIDRT